VPGRLILFRLSGCILEAVHRSAGLGLVALAIVAGLAAGCSTAVSHLPANQSHRPATSVGSPGNPLMLSCGNASIPNVSAPGHRDLVVGPLYIINARMSVDPSGAGPTPQPGYKYPIAVRPGATVTMMIAPSARGHVVIDNPYGPSAGVTAATYQACRPSDAPGWIVFVQGFTFTDGRTRGCVPLIVQAGRAARISYVTISLYAGPCTARADAT
jgi:hypothetical protein